MRLIFALCFALFVGMTTAMVAQEKFQQESPNITLYLPPDIASETVQINYFMSGPFGGYGGYVTTEKGRVSYDIPASVDGKPAGDVKIIAYLPGCEIAKLEITMQGVSESRTLPCKALGRVPLHGRILPVHVAQIPIRSVKAPLVFVSMSSLECSRQRTKKIPVAMIWCDGCRPRQLNRTWKCPAHARVRAFATHKWLGSPVDPVESEFRARCETIAYSSRMDATGLARMARCAGM
jgi:hypothetical protein